MAVSVICPHCDGTIHGIGPAAAAAMPLYTCPLCYTRLSLKTTSVSYPLMGVSEIALYRNVSKQAVVNWRARGKLPPPVATLAMGPIWYTSTILEHFR